MMTRVYSPVIACAETWNLGEVDVDLDEAKESLQKFSDTTNLDIIRT